MKNTIKKLKDKIFDGKYIDFDEAIMLLQINDDSNLEFLCNAANEIRKHFCGDNFDLCTILNAKSGKCSENCKYCAQSAHFNTKVEVYPLLSKEQVLEEAKLVESQGANRFSLVTSGRGLQGESEECEKLIDMYMDINKNTNLSVCASHGIADKFALKKLFDAGVEMYHHNLETSREFYPNICTTHTYDERVETIKNAQEIGLKVCSGGIFGLGETNIDRIKMAFELRKLNVVSVPINILTQIKGTPLEKVADIEPKEILKIIGIYRFILPNVNLRYAGGRVKLGNLQEKGITSGINSALTGNFLTTTGTTIAADKEMVQKNGYKLK